MIITYIILLVLLFYVLGASADMVVRRIKQIADKFKISILSMGMVLGALTTLPEFFVGVNSLVLDVPNLYFGTLMGGIIVVFCLILGFSLVLNRKVKTDGKYSSILPVSLALLLPLFMGLKGTLNYLDGIIFLGIYLIFLYKNTIEHNHINVSDITKNEVVLAKNFFWIITGVILVVFSSNLIVVIATRILAAYNVSALMIGLIVFSLGTNLPELIIAIRSWTRHVPELSLNHIIGSALANILVLGFMLLVRPLSFDIGASYKFLLTVMCIVLFTLTSFYKSDGELTRKEGYKLLVIYLVFIVGQILFS
ncbi:MAG TPA: hypothetical protein P5056_01315 [Candidatus Paceibacterota bacterium]|nr:hypothetical protein [Candidatus Paceibacterota bacterium]